MSSYIALIHRDAGSDYGVSFPDFPGCVTAGATIEEAKAMAVEALEFRIDGMIEDGEPIPVPTDPAAAAVDLPVRKPRTIRVNITLAKEAI